MITIEDIKKLSDLARIKIAPEEQESLRTEIESILGYVDQIKKASKASEGSNVSDTETLRNVFREDVDPHSTGEFTEKLLTASPSREGNYFKVKKIL